MWCQCNSSSTFRPWKTHRLWTWRLRRHEHSCRHESFVPLALVEYCPASMKHRFLTPSLTPRAAVPSSLPISPLCLFPFVFELCSCSWPPPSSVYACTNIILELAVCLGLCRESRRSCMYNDTMLIYLTDSFSIVDCGGWRPLSARFVLRIIDGEENDPLEIGNYRRK